MAKYVFLNVPAHGHINPTIAVVRELVARGENVIYYATEEFRVLIESTGATFRGYESKFMHSMGSMISGSGQDLMRRMRGMPARVLEESEATIPQILGQIRAEQPDYILYDMMCLWGKIIARSLKIPAILLRPSYVMSREFNPIMQNANANEQAQALREAFATLNEKLVRLCEAYDAEPFPMFEMFGGSEPLNLVFIPREFQPHGDKIGEEFVFVGPSIVPRPDTSGFPLEQLEGKQVLYISLGTVFNNQAQFFNTCFAAFKDSPWLVVLSRGKNVDATALDPIPANFMVEPFVPQLDVLQRASVFVTHGGMNSTMESLYYGVPAVAVPQQMEQAITAKRLQELDLGVALEPEAVTVESLREAVERVMNDEGYRTRVREMQQHVRAAGGYKRAADVLIEYERTQREARQSKTL